MTCRHCEKLRAQAKARYQKNRERLKEAARLRYYRDKIEEAKKQG